MPVEIAPESVAAGSCRFALEALVDVAMVEPDRHPPRRHAGRVARRPAALVEADAEGIVGDRISPPVGR